MSSKTVNVLSHKQQKSTLTNLRGLNYRIIGKAKESGLENKRGMEGKQPEQELQLMQWNSTQPPQQPTPHIWQLRPPGPDAEGSGSTPARAAPGTRLRSHCCSYSPSHGFSIIPLHWLTSELPRACCRFSHVWLFATPWTVARQAPLSLGLSRQEYWSG